MIGGTGMNTLLVVDDDEAMRRLIRLSLADSYKVIGTGEPEHALALALEHKPDAILLDLRMPKYSGFELCQTFTSFSSAQMILRGQLADFLKTRRKERRSEVRVRLRVPLRITGTDDNREAFEVHTTTENVSRSAFLCACAVAMLGD